MDAGLGKKALRKIEPIYRNPIQTKKILQSTYPFMMPFLTFMIYGLLLWRNTTDNFFTKDLHFTKKAIHAPSCFN